MEQRALRTPFPLLRIAVGQCQVGRGHGHVRSAPEAMGACVGLYFFYTPRLPEARQEPKSGCPATQGHRHHSPANLEPYNVIGGRDRSTSEPPCAGAAAARSTHPPATPMQVTVPRPASTPTRRASIGSHTSMRPWTAAPTRRTSLCMHRAVTMPPRHSRCVSSQHHMSTYVRSAAAHTPDPIARAYVGSPLAPRMQYAPSHGQPHDSRDTGAWTACTAPSSQPMRTMHPHATIAVTAA